MDCNNSDDFNNRLSPYQCMFKNKSAGNNGELLKNAMLKYWLEEQFCDVVLHLKTCKMPVHKVVLMTFSEYFNRLFTFNEEYKSMSKVDNIDHLDPSIVEKLIEYFYTGEITVVPEYVEHLLEAVDYLQVSTLKEALSDFSSKQLCIDNAVEIYCLANVYNLRKNVVDEAVQMITHNFSDLEEESLFKIPPDLMLDILRSEDLLLAKDIDQTQIAPIKQEENLIGTVLRFYKHSNPPLGDAFLLRCLQLCRLPAVSVNFLLSLKTCDSVSPSVQCVALVDKALQDKSALTPSNSYLFTQDWRYLRKCSVLKIRQYHIYANDRHVIPEKSYFDGQHKSQAPVTQCWVTGIKVAIRLWDGRKVIGGLRVYYNNGTNFLHGIDNQPECHEFHLESDEVITEIHVRSGWLVDNLEFVTSKSKIFGPYGGDGGSLYQEKPPESAKCAYLAWISGAIVNTQRTEAITRLCFTWGFYDLDGKYCSEKMNFAKEDQVVLTRDIEGSVAAFGEMTTGDIVHAPEYKARMQMNLTHISGVCNRSESKSVISYPVSYVQPMPDYTKEKVQYHRLSGLQHFHGISPYDIANIV